MMRTAPPFRADHVGSLLRSPAIKEARARRHRGEIDDAALGAVEDREIAAIVRRQEEIGLGAVTDGEYRRSWWHFDFYGALDGVEIYTPPQGIRFRGTQTPARGVRVVGPLGFPADHPMLGHFRFLRERSSRLPKMTIPSPSVLHFRGHEAARRRVYPDPEAFFDALGETYAAAVRAFYDAGCRYLQLDDTVWAFLCSEEERARARARGHDTDQLPELYARAINRALAGRPAGMTVTMHVCRGNFRSRWISEGGYEPVAELLLGGLEIDGYFLEYDSARAGGFAPLRFLPPGPKVVVLGLVTSKSGALESADDIKRRIDEAAVQVDLDRLCLSPQCGFASTEDGNVLEEEEQWTKLRRIVALAEDVWG